MQFRFVYTQVVELPIRVFITHSHCVLFIDFGGGPRLQSRIVIVLLNLLHAEFQSTIMKWPRFTARHSTTRTTVPIHTSLWLYLFCIFFFSLHSMVCFVVVSGWVCGLTECSWCALYPHWNKSIVLILWVPKIRTKCRRDNNGLNDGICAFGNATIIFIFFFHMQRWMLIK